MRPTAGRPLPAPNVQPVDYDDVAPAYDRRYANNQFDGTLAALRGFLGDARTLDVLEVGCGTGHWLAELAGSVGSVAGLDPSAGMLARARETASGALLVRGEAEHIPWRPESVDRVFAINAMHHFHDKPAFIGEARRILRPGGGVMLTGLDPHAGTDQWWVYDFFPGTLDADRRRYASTGSIRGWLAESGFVGVGTTVAQHIPKAVPFGRAVEMALLDRRSTSQLMVIDDHQYEAGIDRLHREQPILRADLRLMATIGWVAA